MAEQITNIVKIREDLYSFDMVTTTSKQTTFEALLREKADLQKRIDKIDYIISELEKKE